MKIDCVIGIDVGANGGIATWFPGRIEVIKMPKNLIDLRNYFDHIKTIAENPVVFIEHQQAWIQDVNENNGKIFNIQKLLDSYSELKTILKMLNIKYIPVRAQVWQSYLQFKLKGKEKKERKEIYKAAANKWYPQINVTMWNSDALCILHFGRLKKNNEPEWIDNELMNV